MPCSLDLQPNGTVRGPESCPATSKTPVWTPPWDLYGHYQCIQNSVGTDRVEKNQSTCCLPRGGAAEEGGGSGASGSGGGAASSSSGGGSGIGARAPQTLEHYDYGGVPLDSASEVEWEDLAWCERLPTLVHVTDAKRHVKHNGEILGTITLKHPGEIDKEVVLSSS